MPAQSQYTVLLLELLDMLDHGKLGIKGRVVAETGMVTRIDWPEDLLCEASVQGGRARPYTVSIDFAYGSPPETDCGCMAQNDCEHVLAAAIRIAGEAFKQGHTWSLAAEKHLPLGWRRSGLKSLPPAEGNILGPITDAPAETKTAQPRGKVAKGKPWWRNFIDAATHDERDGILATAFRGYAYKQRYSWQVEFIPSELSDERNPIRALRRFGDVVNSTLRSFSYHYEPFHDSELDAFLLSEEAQTLEMQFTQQIYEADLFDWLATDAAPPGGVPQGRLRARWRVLPRLEGPPLLGCDLLLTTAKLNDSPRTPHALRQLNDDVRTERRALPKVEARFLEWLCTYSIPDFVGNEPDGRTQRADHPLEVRDVLAWTSLWAPLGILQWEDGTQVSLDPRPARLTLSPGEEDKLVWHVVLPGATAEMREIPLREAQVVLDCNARLDRGHHPYLPLLEQSLYFVREGAALFRIDTGGMSPEAFIAIWELPGISATRLRESGAGGRLARRLSSTATPESTSESSFVQALPVHCRVELRMDENKMFSLTALATSADNHIFAWAPGNEWLLEHLQDVTPGMELAEIDAENVPASALPAAPQYRETAIALVPRAQDTLALEQWLARTVPAMAQPTGVGHAVAWKLTANQLREFLVHWAERPRGIVYAGSRAVSEMLVLRRPPTISVKVEPSGVDWLQVSVELERDMQFLPYEEVLAALRASEERLVSLSGGRFYDRAELETYREQVEVLAQLGVDPESANQRVHVMQLATGGGAQLLDRAEAAPNLRAMALRFRGMVQAFRGIPKNKERKELAGILRSYQSEGVDFLVWACKSFGGALLADDMGLGKTLQTLAALTMLMPRSKAARKPSLVICPASVAHNWQREANRFAPWLKTVVVERGEARKSVLENAGDYDLVIKNYALARRDIGLLANHEWMLVCVDEAQAIKNPNSEISRTVKSLRAQYRIALTGTPIENRLGDLWSIMDFATPGYLGPFAQFEQAMKQRGAVLTNQLLRSKLRPVILRRMKAEVAPELPPRVEERLDCAMVDSQRKTYLAEVKKTRLLLGTAGDKALQGQARIRILAALTRLRQICCDPGLIGAPEGSGKVDVLMDLLPGLLEAGHKVLIFSQFVKMLDRIRPKVNTLGVPVAMLTGATTRRQELVESFEASKEPALFLISLKAGGTGLNLTSASHVVLFDPWWNPAVEAQAIDRTHRIGQDKTVVAFRLVAEGTIEERIIELQQRKQELVKNVLEAEAFNRALTREDLEFLLG